jgi:hypothetical protein
VAHQRAQERAAARRSISVDNPTFALTTWSSGQCTPQPQTQSWPEIHTEESARTCHTRAYKSKDRHKKQKNNKDKG